MLRLKTTSLTAVSMIALLASAIVLNDTASAGQTVADDTAIQNTVDNTVEATQSADDTAQATTDNAEEENTESSGIIDSIKTSVSETVESVKESVDELTGEDEDTSDKKKKKSGGGGKGKGKGGNDPYQKSQDINSNTMKPSVGGYDPENEQDAAANRAISDSSANQYIIQNTMNKVLFNPSVPGVTPANCQQILIPNDPNISTKAIMDYSIDEVVQKALENMQQSSATTSSPMQPNHGSSSRTADLEKAAGGQAGQPVQGAGSNASFMGMMGLKIEDFIDFAGETPAGCESGSPTCSNIQAYGAANSGGGAGMPTAPTGGGSSGGESGTGVDVSEEAGGSSGDSTANAERLLDPTFLFSPRHMIESTDLAMGANCDPSYYPVDVLKFRMGPFTDCVNERIEFNEAAPQMFEQCKAAVAADMEAGGTGDISNYDDPAPTGSSSSSSGGGMTPAKNTVPGAPTTETAFGETTEETEGPTAEEIEAKQAEVCGEEPPHCTLTVHEPDDRCDEEPYEVDDEIEPFGNKYVVNDGDCCYHAIRPVAPLNIMRLNGSATTWGSSTMEASPSSGGVGGTSAPATGGSTSAPTGGAPTGYVFSDYFSDGEDAATAEAAKAQFEAGAPASGGIGGTSAPATGGTSTTATDPAMSSMGHARLPYMRHWDRLAAMGQPYKHRYVFEDPENAEPEFKIANQTEILSGEPYAGSYDSIIGVGREGENCGMEGTPESSTGTVSSVSPDQFYDNPDAYYGGLFTSLKMYQARIYRDYGLNCMGSYEQLRKMGGAEDRVLTEAGGEYSYFDIMKKKEIKESLQGEGLKGKELKRSMKVVKKVWPMVHRGYITESNCSEGFPYVGMDTEGQESSGIFVDLDNAQEGDIIFLNKCAEGKGEGGGTGAIPPESGRQPYVAYVTETAAALDGKKGKGNGGKKGGKNKNNKDKTDTKEDDTSSEAEDASTEGGQPDLMWVKVIDFNQGKNPDICGVTDAWGQGQERTIYEDKKFLPTNVSDDFKKAGKKATMSCADPNLRDCVDELWDDYRIYRPSADVRGEDKATEEETEETEVNPDIDGDGTPNSEDTDVDGDGDLNAEDTDVDGDGVLNGEDTDIDSDGTANASDDDMDGDGTVNTEDADTDGDGLANSEDDQPDGAEEEESTEDKGAGSKKDCKKLKGNKEKKCLAELEARKECNKLDGTEKDDCLAALDGEESDDQTGEETEAPLTLEQLEDKVAAMEEQLAVLDPAKNQAQIAALLTEIAALNEQLTAVEGSFDADNDGELNKVDNDIDGDKILNAADDNIDGDNLPNDLDPDVDGDGILNEKDDQPNGTPTPAGATIGTPAPAGATIGGTTTESTTTEDDSTTSDGTGEDSTVPTPAAE